MRRNLKLFRSCLVAFCFFLAADAFAPCTHHHRHPGGGVRKALVTSHGDSHRQRLSWPVFFAAKTFDIIIIGGGSAGLTAAKFASTFKKSVALIESSKLGGDCTWTGCVPSKTLLAEAKHFWNWRKMNERFGLDTKNDAMTTYKMLNDVKKRIDENREQIYKEDDSPEVLRSLGIDTVSGRAFLVDKSTVEITPQDGNQKYKLSAKYGVVIATGATPIKPTAIINGIDSVPFWTYENIWEKFFEAMRQRHEKQGVSFKRPTIIVVGGGPIGVELSQALSRLGCSVTIVARSPRLLPLEEKEASMQLQSVLEEEGISVVCGKTVVSVCQNPSGEAGNDCYAPILATLDSNEIIEGDHILVATGRVPNTQNMGFESVGVQMDPSSGGIQVDENLETSLEGVFAAGDCTGDRQFTHYAGFQGAIAARNILLPLKDKGVLEDVPSTIFTDPEVASIGLTEQAACNKFGANAVAVSFRKMSQVDRAICEQTDRHGFIKIVHHARTNQILGATIVSPVAGELISELALAQQNKIALGKIATVTHSYPSYSIALQQMAADVYYEKLKKWRFVYNILKMLGL